jgi:hypothetical protein
MPRSNDPLQVTGDRLIFVYNANAGIAAGIIDSIHKTLSPKTYECSLCAITYGAFAMDRRWKAWLKTLPHDVVFHHRPDFRDAFPAHAGAALPAVFIARGPALETLLGPAAIGAAGSVDGLIAALEAALRTREQAPR